MRVGIIGLGLIGGSLGLALRAAGWHVRGWDVDPHVRAEAVGCGAVDTLSSDPAECDLIVLATPVRAALALLRDLAGQVRSGQIITDVCSTKSVICREAEQCLPQGVWFVGGHPFAGRAEGGIVMARADLFQGAAWVLTSAAPVRQQVEQMVWAVGARPVIMAAAAHDRLAAAISHLPQLTAVALVNATAKRVQEESLGLAGGGWCDTTRIAASPADIWLDILLTNRAPVLAACDQLLQELQSLRQAIVNAEEDDLRHMLQKAAQIRRLVGPKGERL